MSKFELALDRNRAFAAAGGHEGVTVFPDLEVMVLTCLDPRVEPAAFLGIGAGEAMVLRNAGGLVTDAVIEDVAFIGLLSEAMRPEGPLFEVAVVHHTQCGTGALADQGIRERFGARVGIEPDALSERAVLDPEATVLRAVDRLLTAASIPGRVSVSGHVYDVVTGLVHTVVPATSITAAVR